MRRAAALCALAWVVLPGVAAAENPNSWGLMPTAPSHAPDRRLEKCGDHSYNADRRIRECKSLLSDHPDIAEAWLLLAGAYEEAGQIADGIGAVDRALAIVRGFPALRLRAILHAEAGDYDAAKADMDAFVEGDNANGYASRCLVRAIAGRELEVALTDCDEALRIAPRDVDAMAARGLALYKLGRLDDARLAFQAALTRRPERADALFMRGVIASRNGDAAAALNDAKAAREIDPDVAERMARYGVK